MVDHIAENEAQEGAEKPYDASDPKSVNTARRKAGRRKASELEVVRTIMSTVQGRAWMYAILESCMIYGNPFVPGQPDATGFNLGQANVGKRLLGDIMNSAPENYLKMCNEAKSNQN